MLCVFFFCMKKKQKIKLLDLAEKGRNQRLVEATLWCDKVGAADGILWCLEWIKCILQC